jgi:gamma-glutamyltranspeptidase/glutathione hydrolase
MFEQNGNAFDAAVAAAFTLSVVEPSMSGIGGRLQAIYHKSSGKIGGVDASTQVPINYKASMKNILTVTKPLEFLVLLQDY